MGTTGKLLVRYGSGDGVFRDKSASKVLIVLSYCFKRINCRENRSFFIWMRGKSL